MRYTDKLIIVMSALVLTAFALTLPSFGRNQNANSSTTRTQDERAGAAAPDFSKNTWQLPPDADKTKNPVSATDESLQQGKQLYQERTKGNCIFCHGPNGSGNEANLARLRRKPADLSNKERMESLSDGEIFWKLSKGIEGIMPSAEKRMNEEERWHVVNYVRTLPESGKN